MASLYPLVIPLGRISYRETISIKSDLVPWIHITGREDLCAVFEKETVTTRLGFTEQQTLLKVKAGVQALDTVALEDLACQFAVQARRLAASADTPSEFAIYISCPNIALRYLLPNGRYRKVQLLFKDDNGFMAALRVLEIFKLPLVQKSASSQRISGVLTENASISSRLSARPHTIFSYASQSTTAETMPHTQHNLEPSQSYLNARQDTSHSRILSSRQGSAHPLADAIIRPGPSLIESVIETSHVPKRNPWQFSEPSEPRQRAINTSMSENYGLISTQNEQYLNDDWNIASFRREQGLSPTHRYRPVYRYYRGRPIMLQPDHIQPRPNIDLQEEPPISSQLHPPRTRDGSISPIGGRITKTPNQQQSGLTPEAGTIAITDAPSLKRRTKSEASRQDDAERTRSIKTTPKRKKPRKTFKSSSSQTEVLMISKSTQTMESPVYKSASVQVEPSTPKPTFCDKATQVISSELPDPFITAPVADEGMKNAEVSLGNATFTYPIRSRQPGVNKFGRGRKHVPNLMPIPHNAPLPEEITETRADVSSPEKPKRGINKFGLRSRTAR